MKITNRLTGLIALVGALVLGGSRTPAEEAKPEHHEWNYGSALGPAHWGNLKPEFAQCKSGHHQSPIDIERPVKADLPSLTFDYHPSPLRIVDNGHTIMVDSAPGSSSGWVTANTPSSSSTSIGRAKRGSTASASR